MLNKKEGIILEFNGYHGIILSEDKEIIFVDTDIIDKEVLKVGDKVKFFLQEYSFEEEIIYKASMIKKI